MAVVLHNDLRTVKNKLVYLGENQIHSANLKNFLGGVFELLQKSNTMTTPTGRDIDLVFTEPFNNPARSKYYALSGNCIQPNFDSFRDAKGFKILVNLCFTYFDPQIFDHTLTQDALYKENTILDLSSHPFFGGSDKFKSDLNTYLKNVATPVNAFQNILNDIARNAEVHKPDLIVVPLLYFSSYYRSGVLSDSRFLFVPFDHVIDTCLDQVDMHDRNYDVFFSGSSLPFVYPYRALVRYTMQWQTKAPFKFYDDYPPYIANYIIPRANRLDDRLSTEDPSEWQKINDEIEALDSKRYGEYLRQIADCKMSICCSSIFGLPLKKFIESLAMGSVIVGDLPKFPEDCGIEDGINAVQCEFSDLENTIKALLRDEKRLLELANNGLKLVKDRYMPEGAAKTFFSKIENKLNDISKQT